MARAATKQTDAEIIEEAKDRHTRGMAYENDFRRRFTEDVRFINGDPDNHAQWPDEVYNQRTADTSRKPTMTANITAPFAQMIINNTRMNMPQIVVKPTGDESTFKSAEIYEALLRNIQYRSQAATIYIDAHTYQVWGGVGYFRVNTRWDEENPKSDMAAFNTSIFIDPVQSHMSVLLDPNTKQKSGADAKWGQIFEDVDRDQFQIDYPDVDAPEYNKTASDLGEGDAWVRENTIRVCEYYRIVRHEDEMIYISDVDATTGKPIQSIFRMSEAPPGMEQSLNSAKRRPEVTIKRRKVWDKRLEWYKIAGDKIIDRNEKLPGRGDFIPIVRVLGREVIIQGQMDRKGIVRNLKDSQRLFNYYLSSDAEYNALAPKSPYVGYEESFRGHETTWKQLNTSNPPYLPVNAKSDDFEDPLPLPQRQAGPADAPGYRNGMQAAIAHMGLISGIPDAQFGRVSNENSGLAVKERRRGGDQNNYDWGDALAEAVAHAGRIIIDWIPDVYDVARTLKVMGRDGTQSEIQIDPEQKQALQLQKVGEVERAIFNPTVGKYEVVSEIGPSFATQREEAWEAFTAIVSRSPELMNIFGDLMFLTADFPLSDKLAQRMVAHIRAQAPWLLDEAPPPMVQELHKQLGNLQSLNATLLEQLGSAHRKLEDKTRENDRKEEEARARAETEGRNADTREQDAISKRITAVTNAQLDLSREGKEEHFHELLRETMEMADRTQFDPEPFGARKGRDGKFYMDDPDRPGKYLMVG